MNYPVDAQSEKPQMVGLFEVVLDSQQKLLKKNREILEAEVRKLVVDYQKACGVDVICFNISKPWNEGEPLRVNSTIIVP